MEGYTSFGINVAAIDGNEGAEMLRVTVGSTPLFCARAASFDFYLENEQRNRDYKFCTYFTSNEGDRFVYWKDTEIDQGYLSKMPKR